MVEQTVKIDKMSRKDVNIDKIARKNVKFNEENGKYL